ncbi:hypothetical protein LTR36_003794 [Oleoguttula mirabilis]|uniref:Uncharacterized protein n=1 Tax=Oleoguttula mirabilis TaxID=1507867 RepID=A0AAV9JI30_9PEZI|nr:hypothetical protein LTR36_003794 [Oleoguttula mirabilis]
MDDQLSNHLDWNSLAREAADELAASQNEPTKKVAQWNSSGSENHSALRPPFLMTSGAFAYPSPQHQPLASQTQTAFGNDEPANKYILRAPNTASNGSFEDALISVNLYYQITDAEQGTRTVAELLRRFGDAARAHTVSILAKSPTAQKPMGFGMPPSAPPVMDSYTRPARPLRTQDLLSYPNTTVPDVLSSPKGTQEQSPTKPKVDTMTATDAKLNGGVRTRTSAAYQKYLDGGGEVYILAARFKAFATAMSTAWRYMSESIRDGEMKDALAAVDKTGCPADASASLRADIQQLLALDIVDVELTVDDKDDSDLAGENSLFELLEKTNGTLVDLLLSGDCYIPQPRQDLLNSVYTLLEAHVPFDEKIHTAALACIVWPDTDFDTDSDTLCQFIAAHKAHHGFVVTQSSRRSVESDGNGPSNNLPGFDKYSPNGTYAATLDADEQQPSDYSESFEGMHKPCSKGKPRFAYYAVVTCLLWLVTEGGLAWLYLLIRVRSVELQDVDAILRDEQCPEDARAMIQNCLNALVNTEPLDLRLSEVDDDDTDLDEDLEMGALVKEAEQALPKHVLESSVFTAASRRTQLPQVRLALASCIGYSKHLMILAYAAKSHQLWMTWFKDRIYDAIVSLPSDGDEDELRQWAEFQGSFAQKRLFLRTVEMKSFLVVEAALDLHAHGCRFDETQIIKHLVHKRLCEDLLPNEPELMRIVIAPSAVLKSKEGKYTREHRRLANSRGRCAESNTTAAEVKTSSNSTKRNLTEYESADGGSGGEGSPTKRTEGGAEPPSTLMSTEVDASHDEAPGTKPVQAPRNANKSSKVLKVKALQNASTPTGPRSATRAPKNPPRRR